MKPTNWLISYTRDPAYTIVDRGAGGECFFKSFAAILASCPAYQNNTISYLDIRKAVASTYTKEELESMVDHYHALPAGELPHVKWMEQFVQAYDRGQHEMALAELKLVIGNKPTWTDNAMIRKAQEIYNVELIIWNSTQHKTYCISVGESPRFQKPVYGYGMLNYCNGDHYQQVLHDRKGFWVDFNKLPYSSRLSYRLVFLAVPVHQVRMLHERIEHLIREKADLQDQLNKYQQQQEQRGTKRPPDEMGNDCQLRTKVQRLAPKGMDVDQLVKREDWRIVFTDQ